MNRLQSVDVFRGTTVLAMILVNTPGSWSNVFPPLLHANWHGLTPTDLIFPFFLFIVGISISLAYNGKTLNTSVLKKIVIRSSKLVGLGLFLNWFFPYFPFFSDVNSLRIPGVLQRIGIVFLITSILFLKFNRKTLVYISIGILVGYYVLLSFIPLPNGEIPTLDRLPNNWANYIDIKLLGNHLYKPDYDPEGILSTLPSIVTSLLGVFTGLILKEQTDYLSKIKKLLFSAVVLLLIGYVWDIYFPINKALWSSSFVLVTAGWAILVLLFCYFIYDVKKVKVGLSLSYAGANAIAIYFASSFLSKTFYLVKVTETESIHGWLYTICYTNFISNPKLSSLLYAITVVFFYSLMGYVMYKKKIFIKV